MFWRGRNGMMVHRVSDGEFQKIFGIIEGQAAKLTSPHDIKMRAKILTAVAALSKDQEKIASAYQYVRSHISKKAQAQCLCVLAKAFSEMRFIDKAKNVEEEIPVAYMYYKAQALMWIAMYSGIRADEERAKNLSSRIEDESLRARIADDMEIFFNKHHHTGRSQFGNFKECHALAEALEVMQSRHRKISSLGANNRVKKHVASLFEGLLGS